MLNLNTTNQKVEVLNWGVPGYSTAQEIRLVRRALSTYQPDLIVLEVTLNDPEMQPYRVTHSYQNAQGEVLLNNPIFSYWQSLGFIVRRIENTITQREYKQYYFDLYEHQDTWSRFADSAKEIKHRTTMAKVPLVAMLFPLFSHRLDDEYPFRKLHEKVGALFASLDIPLLDLYPFFRGIPTERLQVIPGTDGHPNEIAHRIAADALYLDLAGKKLIPEFARIHQLSLKRTLKHPFPAPKKSTRDQEK